MPQGLPKSSAVWANFKTVIAGGDINDTTVARRELYTAANEAEPELEELPKVEIDTAKLFMPENFLQPVPREGEKKQATIGPVTQEVKAEKSTEGERPQLPIEQFKLTQPGLAANPIMGVIEKLVPDAQSQIVGGVTDFISNTLDGIGQVTKIETFSNLARQIPEIEKSDKLSANLVRGIAQTATMFVPMLGLSSKVLSGAPIAAKALAADSVASAFTDFFAFKGTDTRVADLIIEHFPNMKQWPHIGSMLEYLEGEPSDSELTGRWKNVVEGQLLSGLIGAIPNAKNVARDFFNLTSQIQKVNYLSKYMGNQLGAIGDPDTMAKFSARDIAQGKARLQKAEVEKTKFIETPSVRLKSTQEAMKHKPFSEEQLQRMADEYSIPLKEVNNLLQPGQVKSIEEQAALVGTLREVNKEIKSLADHIAKNPYTDDGYQALDAKVSELTKLYSAYVGAGSEAGASLKAHQTLNDVLVGSGMERILRSIETYKLGTRDEKLLFAQRLSAVAEKDQNRFLKATGARVSLGKKLTEAVAEAYISTRFTPMSVAKNVVSNIIFDSGLVVERALAGVLGPKDSPITFKESLYLAHGMLADVDTAFKVYLHHAFNPGQAAKAVDLNAKFDAYEAAITAKKFELEGTYAGGFLDAIGHIIRFFPNQMQATDEAFKTVLRRGEMQALAYREARQHADALVSQGVKGNYKDIVHQEYKRLLEEQPDWLLEAADKFAHYGTFTDQFTAKTKLGALAKSYQDVANEYPLIKLLFPFFKTPVRITQAALKRTPGIGHFMRDSQEMAAASDAEAIALNRAKQAMGAMVGIAGIGLWMNGQLIGEGPSPQDQKSRDLMNMKQQQSHSLVVSRFEDGTVKSSVPFKDMPGAYGIAFKLFGTLGEVGKTVWDYVHSGGQLTRKQEDAIDNLYGKALSSMGRLIEDQVFFKNIVTLLGQAKSGNEKAVNRWLASYVPPMSKELAAVFDKEVKEVETLLDMVKVTIPGLRNTVTSKTDILGQDYIEGSGVLAEQASPGIVGYLATRVNPLTAIGNWDTANQVIMDFQGKYIDRISGLKPYNEISTVKLSTEQKNVFNKIRAGVEAETAAGKKIQPIRDKKGMTLKEHWLTIAINDKASDTFRITSYNKQLEAFTKLAELELRKHYPDLDKEVQQAVVDNKMN